MNVYDYVPAHTVEEGDFVMVGSDPIEVTRVVDETDTIMVEGDSHLTGDKVVYMLAADMEVGLWGA